MAGDPAAQRNNMAGTPSSSYYTAQSEQYASVEEREIGMDELFQAMTETVTQNDLDELDKAMVKAIEQARERARESEMGTGFSKQSLEEIAQRKLEQGHRKMLKQLRITDFKEFYPERIVTSPLPAAPYPIDPDDNCVPPASERYGRHQPPLEGYSSQLKDPLPFPKAVPRNPSKKIAAQAVQENFPQQQFPFGRKQTIEGIRRNMDFLLSEPTMLDDLSFARQHYGLGNFDVAGAEKREAEELERRKEASQQHLNVPRQPTWNGALFLTDRCSSSTYATAEGETPPPGAFMCKHASKPCMSHLDEHKSRNKRNHQSTAGNPQEPMLNPQQLLMNHRTPHGHPPRQAARHPQQAEQHSQTLNPLLLSTLPDCQGHENPLFDSYYEDLEKAAREIRNGPSCHYCATSKPGFAPDPPNPTWAADPNFGGGGNPGVVADMEVDVANVLGN